MSEVTRNRKHASLRRAFALALALASSTFSCLGGQTGQPMVDGGGCPAPTVNVPVNEPIRGVVPADAAQALEGSYTQPLVWVDDFGERLPDLAADQMVLTFTYEGGIARYNPCAHGGPDIQMTLDLSLRDSGLVETATAWVSFYPEPPGADGVFGEFSFSTPTTWMIGSLTRTNVGTAVSGTLMTSALPSPLSNGRFP
jgi:hypothetical protein